MSSETITYLTDAVLITAVVPVGRADAILKATRDVGASGGIVHLARGTGARERLGLLSIAVEAEKEVVRSWWPRTTRISLPRRSIMRVGCMSQGVGMFT